MLSFGSLCMVFVGAAIWTRLAKVIAESLQWLRRGGDRSCPSCLAIIRPESLQCGRDMVDDCISDCFNLCVVNDNTSEWTFDCHVSDGVSY